MRGRVQIFSIIAILSVVLVVSAVFASGIVDVSKFSLNSGPIQPDSPGTTVFVDPPYYFKDYTLQPVGSTFTVYINITEATGLFTWQVNLTYNTALLNVKRIIASEFLARDPNNQTSSEVLGLVINSTDNVVGASGFAETLLGMSGGVTGNGRLVSVEFKVMGYGSCDLVISTSGNLGTVLLSGTGSSISFTKTNGYFSNKAVGDIDGDRDVDQFDFGAFAPCYGSVAGMPAYNREADLDHDGDVDQFDFGLFAPNYGRSV